MADPLAPGLAPDQGGGPTWGSIAMPATPSAMAVYSPGIQTMGGLAADTAFNAKRAQNLAAFEEFQRLNPNATAADLSHAAENITGGDSLLGGSFTPSVMSDIANKNRLQLQAQQAKEQGDITATYMTAMEQAINTAADPSDWVQKAKALMPQSSWGSFDNYIGGKNTEDMFKVYQQRRVAPIIKDGVDFMWDTVDKYTTAAGGNAALGQMAYDLAKPQVDAAKLANAEKIKVEEANIYQSRAAAGASFAAAGASNAEQQLRLQQTKNAQIDANNSMMDMLDKTADNFLVQSGVGSGDPANQQAAFDYAQRELYGRYGHTPQTEALYNQWKAGAPASVAATTSARINALDMQAAANLAHDNITAPTAGLQAQYHDTSTALNALDQPTFAALSKDDQTKFKPLAVSAAQNILADKNIGVTDSDLFNKTVADMTIAGKTPDQIRDVLRKTISPKSGLPVIGDATYLQSKINDSFAPAAPMNEPELKKQLDDMTAKTITSMGNLENTLRLPVGQGGSVADIQANYQQVKQDNDRTLYSLQRTLADLNDRNRQGMIWAKDPATKSFLSRKINELQAKATELRIMWDKRADLKVATEAAGPAVNIAGADYKVTTDIKTLAPGSEDGVINAVQSITAQDASDTRKDPATGAKLPPTFSPQFLAVLRDNPEAAKVTALAAQEINRIDTARMQTPPSSTKLGAGGFNPKAQPGARIGAMSDLQVGQIVDQIIAANKDTLGWTDTQQQFMANEITKLMLHRKY